jgi:hypothetical protein
VRDRKKVNLKEASLSNSLLTGGKRGLFGWSVLS